MIMKVLFLCLISLWSINCQSNSTNVNVFNPYDTDISIILVWDQKYIDLDLRVVEPNSTELSWEKKNSTTGGTLYVDNAGLYDKENTEIIYWPKNSNALRGAYSIRVAYFAYNNINATINDVPKAKFYLRTTVGSQNSIEMNGTSTYSSDKIYSGDTCLTLNY